VGSVTAVDPALLKFFSSWKEMAKLESLRRIPWSEIQKHDHEENAWIVIGGYVYEMHQFLKVHPGGAELITPHLAKDSSAAFMDLKSHVHSRNAQNMLRKFRVGIVEDKPQSEVERDAAVESKTIDDVPTIDWNRGLVLQASALGDKYQKWVHNCFFPNSAQTLKYFDNPILEALTKNPWWIIPLVWFPIVTFLFYYAVTQLGQNPMTIPIFMVLGTSN
jgi:4-hydroxysphinganine ceramide fatty acyl 2-hydroxylase